MSIFICPVCGNGLNKQDGIFSCASGHCFDIAKSGYVNLMLARSPKTKQHGDDKVMVRSRQSFLDKGYYRPLLDGICQSVGQYAKDEQSILDAGCGECWYTAGIYEHLVRNGITPDMSGVDISKDALAAGAKRNRSIRLAVASIFSLPVGDLSCDMLLSFFAPFCAPEFGRVLKDDGIIIRVFPLENHLWSLKKAVYDSPYKNEIEDYSLEGFELLHRSEVRDTITLPCGEDILNLFSMTPYYYKTSNKDREKLSGLSSLITEIEFGIAVYRKIIK